MLILERPWKQQPQARAIALNERLIGRRVAAACVNPAFPSSSSPLSESLSSPVIKASQFGFVLESELNYGSEVNRPLVAIKPFETVFSYLPSTVLVRYTPRAVSTDSVGVGIAGLSNNSRPYLGSAGIYIGQNDSSALFFSRRDLRLTVASVFEANKPCVLASHSPASSSFRAFIDGVFSSSVSVVNDVHGSWFCGGSGPEVGSTANKASPPGDVEMMLCLLGPASDAEVSRISLLMLRDPWALIAPRRIYIPTAAAASGAPSITALSAISITATSAQPRISYS